MKKILILISILFILAMPALSFAQDEPDTGLVPCSEGTDCGFKEFMELINNVIDFIFTYMALPIAAIMFAYAGFVMVTSAGSTEARSKAKNIFSDAVIGLLLAAGSWLIIKTLLSIMGYKYIGLFF